MENNFTKSLPEAIPYDGHEEGIPALIIADALDNPVKKNQKKIITPFVITIILLAVTGILYIVFTNYSAGMAEKKALEQKLFQDSIAKAQANEMRRIKDSLSSAYKMQSEQLANDNISTDSEMRNFVRSFYQSLELTKGENEHAYQDGDVKFDKSLFLSLVSSNAVYSSLRIEKLTGNAHDRYYIQLVDIDTLYKMGDKLFAKTKVSYGIYEIGEFINSEELELIIESNKLKLIRWSDLDVLEANINTEYEGNSEIKKTDLYTMMGRTLPESIASVQ